MAVLNLNESITWHLGHSYMLYTISEHADIATRHGHRIDTGWQQTWRSAAVHWKEGTGGWGVKGSHWIRYPNERAIHDLGHEYVTNCSVYDGWGANMVRKLFFIFGISVPIFIHAVPAYMENAKEGLNIVPLSSMRDDKVMMRLFNMETAQEKKRGYLEVSTQRNHAPFLLNTQKTYAQELRFSDNKTSSYDTSLRRNLSQIKLAFSFMFSPYITSENIFGYAPAGGFISSGESTDNYSPNEGWTGIVVSFKDPSIGPCAFSLFNLGISHGKVVIAKESLKYIVNHKPSTSSIVGNKKSGFVYSVGWTTESPFYDSRLECASVKFHKSILSKVIQLANIIDKTTTVK